MSDADIHPEEVLFLGMGVSFPAWYRMFMPALTLQCDWAGMTGKPGTFKTRAAHIGGRHVEPDMDKYKIIVVQQPWGTEWLNWILSQKRKGRKILVDMDDDLHSVAKTPEHPNSKIYKKRLHNIERCMKAADGLIVSTDALAKRYRKFNSNIWVCENGIDFDRYQYSRPERSIPIIGWSGGIGQETVLNKWLFKIQEITKNGDSKFMSIGLPYARNIPGAIEVPFVPIECYPAALANFDVALAPSLRNNFWKAKSQLRYIESSALGIPVVGDRFLYTHIEHGVTGMHADTQEELQESLSILLGNHRLRKDIGENARQYVKENFHIADKCEAWIDVFEEVA